MAESSVETEVMANESCYVKWLYKRWSGFRSMTLMSRSMNVQISLMLKKEIGTPVFDGNLVSSWSKEIED